LENRKSPYGGKEKFLEFEGWRRWVGLEEGGLVGRGKADEADGNKIFSNFFGYPSKSVFNQEIN
jgi:hypothetical protein